MTKNAALTAEYAGEKTFAALRKERLFAERLRPLVFVAAFVCVFYLALAARGSNGRCRLMCFWGRLPRLPK